MRLLNVYTFELVEFESDNIPPYKITSHRWISDETSMKDFVKKRNTLSRGYKKIEGFCRFVRQDNERLEKHVTNDLSACEWIWIDTACMNKRSDAEISDSINSMFGWYSRALDVWFTRGWTLQELLVPRFVIFLNKDWEVIGHKCAHCNYESPCRDAGALLNNVLAEITGIPEDIMSDYDNSKDLGIDEKMSWMANRTTTKTEDMAYCLMGIFDVNMSLLYGEGKKAMARLERKIASRKRHAISESLVGTEVKSKMERMEVDSNARLMNLLRLTARPASGSTEQPIFSCQLTDCASAGVSFRRKADLNRHLEIVHGTRGVVLFDCDIRSCHRRGDYGFTRKDKMREHIIMSHRNSGANMKGP
ncbi:hypothetical protein LTR27_012524 [Elasticomyces elasticus]|nr:hypothetical protein LTR27_012524 [Elasticomyces elasticus]